MPSVNASHQKRPLAQAETEATEAWYGLFKAFADSPSASAYVSLFQPDAVIVDGGLTSSYGGADIARSAELLLKAIPDLKIKPVRSSSRNGSVFIETENCGSLDGKAVSWGTCYVATLTGDLASRFRIYADHTQILKPLLSGAPDFPGYKEVWNEKMVGVGAAVDGRPDPFQFIDAYQKLWRNPTAMGFSERYTVDGKILNPGMPRPITKPEILGYYEWLLRRIPDLSMALMDWAGDDSMVYAEWLGTGKLGGKPFYHRVVDVFHFNDHGVYFGQAYYDTLKSIARLAPEVTKLREKLFVASA